MDAAFLHGHSSEKMKDLEVEAEVAVYVAGSYSAARAGEMA